jgi:predicted DNA-binding transcriptional regulator AlpA
MPSASLIALLSSVALPSSDTASPSTTPHGSLTPLFLTDRQVALLLGCARASVWRAVQDDAGFPRPVRLIGRRVGWRVCEIEQWAAALPPARSNARPE